MNATKALKEYFGREPNAGEKMTARELLDFKKDCPPDEYQAFGKQACEAMGEPYEAPAVPE